MHFFHNLLLLFVCVLCTKMQVVVGNECVEIPSLDLLDIEASGYEAFQKEGIVALRNVPGLDSVRTKALKIASSCLFASDMVQNGVDIRLDGNIHRRTIASESKNLQRTESFDFGGLEHSCLEKLSANVNILREIVRGATRNFSVGTMKKKVHIFRNRFWKRVERWNMFIHTWQKTIWREVQNKATALLGLLTHTWMPGLLLLLHQP